jgi:hypothetical protein
MLIPDQLSGYGCNDTVESPFPKSAWFAELEPEGSLFPAYPGSNRRRPVGLPSCVSLTEGDAPRAKISGMLESR